MRALVAALLLVSAPAAAQVAQVAAAVIALTSPAPGAVGGPLEGPTDLAAQRYGGDLSRPSPAKVVAADATVDGGALVQDDINRVIRARVGLFKACYMKELARSPNLAGKVVVQFTIGADGTVSKQKVVESTLRSQPVESCILGELGKLEFPAKGSETVMKLPLVMTSA